eukprot:6193335-Pleurochrysis_carterae.AAC.3
MQVSAHRPTPCGGGGDASGVSVAARVGALQRFAGAAGGRCLHGIRISCIPDMSSPDPSGQHFVIKRTYKRAIQSREISD